MAYRADRGRGDLYNDLHGLTAFNGMHRYHRGLRSLPAAAAAAAISAATTVASVTTAGVPLTLTL